MAKEIPFTNAQIAEKVVAYVNAMSDKAKKRNPHLVEQLLALKESDISLDIYERAFKTGKFYIECNIRGDYDAYGEQHTTSTVPLTVTSNEMVCPITYARAGYNEAPAQNFTWLAAKVLRAQEAPHLSVGDHNAPYIKRGEGTFDYSNWTTNAVQAIAENVAARECREEKMTLSYCRVVNYEFEEITPATTLTWWGVGVTLKDEKGQDLSLHLGYVLPKTSACDDFEISLSFSLPLNAANDTKEKVKNIVPLVVSAIAVVLAIIFGRQLEFLYGTAGVSMILYFLPNFMNKGPVFKTVMRILSVILAVATIVFCIIPLLGGGGQAEGTPTALLSLLR